MIMATGSEGYVGRYLYSPTPTAIKFERALDGSHTSHIATNHLPNGLAKGVRSIIYLADHRLRYYTQRSLGGYLNASLMALARLSGQTIQRT